MIKALTIVVVSCQKYPARHQEHPAERTEQDKAYRRWLFSDELTHRQRANDQVCEVTECLAKGASATLSQS